MESTTRRATRANGTKIGVTVCALIVACTTSSPQSAGTSSETPDGATPTTMPDGLTGCGGETEPPGCFAFEGAYTHPATSTCSDPGGPVKGSADAHCNGVTPQTVSKASCNVGGDAGPPASPTGPCGEGGDYGITMHGTEGDDDDCKYHVSYTSTPICENDGVYFTVTANYLTGSKGPLTGACTLAELCQNVPDTPGGGTPGPAIDGRPTTGGAGKQEVVEGPPGTYTIGPVQFDASGTWTVRFHFNEICCDVADDSPHGHAAFLIDVP
jgi:hypothetical protein